MSARRDIAVAVITAAATTVAVKIVELAHDALKERLRKGREQEAIAK